MESQSADLEDRIRKISDSSDEQIGDEPTRTTRYIDQRQALVEDLDAHFKEARRIVREISEKASRLTERELNAGGILRGFLNMNPRTSSIRE
jgi:hypothetical protein